MYSNKKKLIYCLLIIMERIVITPKTKYYFEHSLKKYTLSELFKSKLNANDAKLCTEEQNDVINEHYIGNMVINNRHIMEYSLEDIQRIEESQNYVISCYTRRYINIEEPLHVYNKPVFVHNEIKNINGHNILMRQYMSLPQIYIMLTTNHYYGNHIPYPSKTTNNQMVDTDNSIFIHTNNNVHSINPYNIHINGKYLSMYEYDEIRKIAKGNYIISVSPDVSKINKLFIKFDENSIEIGYDGVCEYTKELLNIFIPKLKIEYIKTTKEVFKLIETDIINYPIEIRLI